MYIHISMFIHERVRCVCVRVRVCVCKYDIMRDKTLFPMPCTQVSTHTLSFVLEENTTPLPAGNP